MIITELAMFFFINETDKLGSRALADWMFEPADVKVKVESGVFFF